MNPAILEQILKQVCEKCGECTIIQCDDGWQEIRTKMLNESECVGWIFFQFNKEDCPFNTGEKKIKVEIQ